jgi:signal transduction histidine kinase
MRSLYTQVLTWSTTILAVFLVVFLVIARSNRYAAYREGAPIGANLNAEIRRATRAYQTSGPEGLAAVLESLEVTYPGTHRYLLDSSGRDLLTGEDRSKLLESARRGYSRYNLFSTMLVAKTDESSPYVFIFVPNPALMFAPVASYYLLLLGAIVLMGWVLAFRVVSPLKKIAAAVRRFGTGDLSARVPSTRRDELGDLANAFNEMAERIQTLLTAERRLLQDISHELRSPLARLSFAAELARTSPDRDAAIARVTREMERLTELVQSLLQVTRTEGDPDARRLEPVSLVELTQELVDDCELEANARGCRLSLRGSNCTLHADRELLRRAIENIIRNAIRHAPEGTNIEVVLHHTASNASISVRDYGPGVPPEALADIFKPFFRVDQSRDTATGGVGLGLAIAERAISVHHGKIWAENAAPGLRVCVDLPLHGVA